MMVGEQGEIVEIDPRINNRLMTAGIGIGVHILVVARKQGTQFMPASICIQIGRKIFVITEEEAALILINIKTREPVNPLDRPQIWRPYWPYFPHWGNIY